MLSFWEKNSFVKYDVVIIGSGIVGLSAACSIKEKSPDKKILVLERGLLPTGASTKNAGFATFSGVDEIMADLENGHTEDDILQLVEDRWVGLQMLRKRLGDDAIDFQNNGGNDLILHGDDFDLGAVEKVNALLKPVFNKNIFFIREGLIESFGFRKSKVKNLIHTPLEGQIDTGKMMQSLLTYSRRLDVSIITGCEVSSFDETANDVIIHTQNGIDFFAEQLIVCTNAFTQKLLPALDVVPGRGQVLATSVIPGLKLKGIYYFDRGYYYFRNYYGRLIFGGGRNMDINGEETPEISLNESIQNSLDFYLKDFILPYAEYTIEHRWVGIMAFGKGKLPIVEKLSPRIFVGVRMSGMGVALGSLVGERLSGLIHQS